MPRLSAAILVVTLLSCIGAFPAESSAQTDLDAFMKDVVARRDDNWKKLQQYILDEREELVLNGPGGLRLWGEQRDYTWFLRDGFFIKSPVRANGATVGEADRRKFEDLYLQRVQRREGRPSTGSGRAAAGENAPPDSQGFGAVARPDNNDPSTSSGQVPEPPPTSVDGLIRQTRQPQFVSSSYFLRFKFDEGRYALAGREKFDGRDVLRIEYYPTKLFGEDNRRGRGRGRGREISEKEQQRDAEFRKLLNKVAHITLWVEPSTKQIVKYTFDNVDFEFLPAQWFLTVDSLTASMTMGQPFKDVWLPKDIQISAQMTFAIGQFFFRQTTGYRDYREAEVKSRVIIK